YNPAIYQDGMSVDKWQSLISDPFKPLFDKTTGGSFAPGSVYKPVVGLAALSEGVIHAHTKFRCHGSMELGRDVFHCYKRSGHGQVALATALMKSCDVYFYNVGLELGADKIAKYARDLGLGRKYGIRLNREDSGLIPDSAWIRKTLGRGWMLGEIPNLAIGQGANLLTPLQIAVLYAAIANGGKVWRPYLVQKAVNYLGQVILEHQPELLHQSEFIRPEHFALTRQMLQGVVMAPEGTGARARVPGVTVAGKTGSVQVVGLNRHRNRKDKSVSMKWQEHAMFAAFSPTEDAQIVVAVVSQNDPDGGGGASAAPVARKIIAKYWDLQKERSQSRVGQAFDIADRGTSMKLEAL
ncbi:MAG: penicillin-binding transpeptidase domain-containing protein, partial [Zetaproteobacteria bacterium]|nr:penicillin-binding transpeptidase domain-containing protein [Zetaproteobacteria bacterium]